MVNKNAVLKLPLWVSGRKGRRAHVGHGKETQHGHLRNGVELSECGGNRDSLSFGDIEEVQAVCSQAALTTGQKVVAASSEHNIDTLLYLLQGYQLLVVPFTGFSESVRQEARLLVHELQSTHRLMLCEEKAAGVASVMRQVTTSPVRIPCQASGIDVPISTGKHLLCLGQTFF